MIGPFRYVDPSTISPPLGPYSHAVEVPAGATWLHVSGQVAVDETGTVIGRGDLGAQLEQVFTNVDRLLAAAGYAWANVVETTTYLTREADVDAYRSARLPLYERYYPSGTYPTSTLLVVERLAHPDFLLEMQLVAAR